MAIIFWLSSKTADESAAQSSVIVKWIINHFGKNSVTDFIVRKLAHFSVYTVLGTLALFALSFHEKLNAKKRILFSSLICLAYAVSDEIHQYFVPGRSCRLLDILIDFCGSLFGISIIFIITLIITKNKIKINDK